MAEDLTPETPATDPVTPPEADALPPVVAEATPEPAVAPSVPEEPAFTHPILDLVDVFRGNLLRNIGPRIESEVYNIADATVRELRAEALAFLKEK